MANASALVVIDYQNIHLTGHERFAPKGTAKHLSLVHPLAFAAQVLKRRNGTIGARHTAGDAGLAPVADLAKVAVFRGAPSQKHDAAAYRRSQAQRSEWTRDRRVQVHYRTLNYHWDRGLGAWVKREKGIDVAAAVALVSGAFSGAWEVVILASHDTDLEPALELAATDFGSQCSIETAGWQSSKVLRPKACDLWHTTLNGADFVNSRDRKDYT